MLAGKVVSSWSVYLTTLFFFWPKRLTSTHAHVFRQKLTTSMNQRRGENAVRHYFMINLHERMVPDPSGIQPPDHQYPTEIISHMPLMHIRLSHRGRPLSFTYKSGSANMHLTLSLPKAIIIGFCKQHRSRWDGSMIRFIWVYAVWHSIFQLYI